MMRKLGFSEGWVTIMMSCVRSVRYQGLIQKKLKCFSLQGVSVRGISTLHICSLFVQKVNLVSYVGGIDGLRVCRNAPPASHLIFVDDSLIP
jgi:hypothetical protein